MNLELEDLSLDNYYYHFYSQLQCYDTNIIKNINNG